MRYTKAQLAFLQEGYRSMRVPELTIAFNAHYGLDKSRGAIKCALSNHGFVCGRPTGGQKGRFKLFTQAQADFIRDGYPMMPLQDLVAAVNAEFGTEYTFMQVRAFTRNHKLRSGRTGKFEQGHETWNAGTKGLMKPNRTTFAKGHKNNLERPMGSERVDNKDGYVWIKVAEENPHTGAPARFRQKHHLVWEEVNPPVPEGHVLTFINNDRLDCRLENLRMISRRELAWINKLGFAKAPAELREAVLATAALECKTRMLEEARS